VATDEDEEAKERVQEAVWAWTIRVVVLLVVFIFGTFTGWVLWGAGDTGAVQLRPMVTDLENQVSEQKKRVIDCEGKLTVVQGRMDEIQRAMQRTTGNPP
jgi:uncharacterized membrane protein SpoIIM required for sporulation